MVKCAAATPKKKIPPSHSFGIDSLFFLLHSHSLAHSFNSSDTQKTANDSNIQNQFQNETNEFLCDNFFFHPLLSRSFALARSLSLYYVPKRIFYTHCACALHTQWIHLFIRFHIHIPWQKSICELSLRLYYFFSAASCFLSFFILCFFFVWILSTVYLLECECWLSVVDKVHYSYLVTHIRYSLVVYRVFLLSPVCVCSVCIFVVVGFILSPCHFICRIFSALCFKKPFKSIQLSNDSVCFSLSPSLANSDPFTIVRCELMGCPNATQYRCTIALVVYVGGRKISNVIIDRPFFFSFFLWPYVCNTKFQHRKKVSSSAHPENETNTHTNGIKLYLFLPANSYSIFIAMIKKRTQENARKLTKFRASAGLHLSFDVGLHVLRHLFSRKPTIFIRLLCEWVLHDLYV